MIKITSLPSKNSNIHIFAIPGGPGLSSLTLRGLDLLQEVANLHYVDFPGTNDNPYQGKKSIHELAEELSIVMRKYSGRLFILGHSYGGFVAACVARKIHVEGLMCLGTPFTSFSLLEAANNYHSQKSPSLLSAISRWSEAQNDKNFALWLSEYESLYFMPHSFMQGKKLIHEDKVSAQFFLDNGTDIKDNPQVYDFVCAAKIKKMSLFGLNEGLIPVKCLRQEAKEAGFKVVEIPEANHFLMVDQPLKVKEAIENFILKC